MKVWRVLRSQNTGRHPSNGRDERGTSSGWTSTKLIAANPIHSLYDTSPAMRSNLPAKQAVLLHIWDKPGCPPCVVANRCLSAPWRSLGATTNPAYNGALLDIVFHQRYAILVQPTPDSLSFYINCFTTLTFAESVPRHS